MGISDLIFDPLSVSAFVWRLSTFTPFSLSCRTYSTLTLNSRTRPPRILGNIAVVMRFFVNMPFCHYAKHRDFDAALVVAVKSTHLNVFV